MADEEKKSRRKTSETARRIWLAGIGAYGRAFSEAQEALKDVTGGTSKVFDELVQKGEFIEMTVEAKRKDILDKAGMPSISVPNINMPNLNMDERISAMRSRLMRGEEVAEDLSGMDARLTEIETKLDKILALLEDKPAPKPKRKPTTKKTTTKKTSKS